MSYHRWTDEKRTYIDGGKTYLIPNDAPEHVRLDEQAAALFELMHNRHYHAPLSSPKRIVDLGCGTGAVTVAMGRSNPNALVLGIDLSPVPAQGKPPNVEFIQGNIRDLAGTDDHIGWETMDLVYSRLLAGGMRDWPSYVRLAAKLAKPGAYVELQDIWFGWYRDGRDIAGNTKWIRAIYEESAKLGLSMDAGLHLQTWMQDAGLEIVEAKFYPLPLGTWAKDKYPESERYGKYAQTHFADLFFHLIGKLLEGKRGADEIRELQTDMQAFLVNEPNIYGRHFVVVGRKPML